MRLRGVWPANAAALLTGISMYASFLIIPELVQAPARLGYGFGASVTGAGLACVRSPVLHVSTGWT